MRNSLDLAHRWEQEGHAVAAATLVTIGGSTSPRSGSRLLVSSGGESEGSVSFGCVEADVGVHCAEVLATGQPRIVTYGMTDEDAFAVGFSCGGTMLVFIEPWTGLHDRLGGVPDDGFSGALATVTEGPGAGSHVLFADDGTIVAGDAAPTLANALADGAAEVAVSEQAQVVESGGARVFLEPVVPPPPLFIYGGGHVAQALTAAAAAVGFRVIVADHRPVVASSEHYPEAAEVLVGWPDVVVPTVDPGPQTHVVVLSHNAEVEDLLLPAVLARGPKYVGVLGSPRTHAARVQRLTSAGVPSEQLALLHAPVGLDIGAASPEEIAVSIVAELIAVRRGHPAGLPRVAHTDEGPADSPLPRGGGVVLPAEASS